MNANDGHPPVRRVTIVVGVGAIAALGFVVIGLIVWFAAGHRHAVDSRVIADVVDQLRQELARLGPDSEIYRRYGQFQTLEGSGFERPSYIGQLGKRVECRRQAVFANGTVGVDICVANTGPLDVNIRLTPSESWLREHSDAKVVKHGDEFRIEFPEGSARCNIDVSASHPEFIFD